MLKEYEERRAVWYSNGRIYKFMPKFLADNELYFLNALEDTGYVPTNAQREDVSTVSMDYVEPQHVTDRSLFMSHYDLVLDALRDRGVRHGDLTEYAVIVRDNAPVIIDFAEARLFDSPIPSKRRVPDSELLLQTMEKLCTGQPLVHKTIR